jgi:hypothetical protein
VLRRCRYCSVKRRFLAFFFFAKQLIWIGEPVRLYFMNHSISAGLWQCPFFSRNRFLSQSQPKIVRIHLEPNSVRWSVTALCDISQKVTLSDARFLVPTWNPGERRRTARAKGMDIFCDEKIPKNAYQLPSVSRLTLAS